MDLVTSANLPCYIIPNYMRNTYYLIPFSETQSNPTAKTTHFAFTIQLRRYYRDIEFVYLQITYDGLKCIEVSNKSNLSDCVHVHFLTIILTR